jgi:hypothetical protein
MIKLNIEKHLNLKVWNNILIDVEKNVWRNVYHIVKAKVLINVRDYLTKHTKQI